MPELVQDSPSLTPDGSLVLGSVQTSVLVVNAATGDLMHAFAEVGGSLAEFAGYAGACHTTLALVSAPLDEA